MKRLFKESGVDEEIDKLSWQANSLNCGILTFKELAIREGLVRDDEDFSERIAIDVDYKNGHTYLLLKEGKTHDKLPFGGYKTQTYDAYKLG